MSLTEQVNIRRNKVLKIIKKNKLISSFIMIIKKLLH